MKFFQKRVQTTDEDGHRKIFQKPSLRIQEKIDGFKQFLKKDEDPCDTKVTRVRIIVKRRRFRPRPVPEPPKEATKEDTTEQIPKDNVQPPSPTCKREQAKFDANMHAEEEKQDEKEADSSPGWNARLSGMDCSHPKNSLGGNVLGNWGQSEATKRWVLGDWDYFEPSKRLEEMKEKMTTKMKSIHEKIFGDLGDFTSAVENNRDDMDQMVVIFDKENNVVADSVTLLWDEEEKQEEDDYGGPLITCNDMKAYYCASSKATREEERLIEPCPSI